MALALRADPGGDAHVAAGFYGHPGALIRADAGALDIVDDGDADPLAGSLPPRLFHACELFIADQFQRAVEGRCVVAAVVDERREVLENDLVVVGELIRADEVVAADRYTIDRQLASGDVEQTLDDKDAVLTTGAAIRCNDRLVGEDAGELGVVMRYHIGTEDRALAADGKGQAIGSIGAGVVQKGVSHS